MIPFHPICNQQITFHFWHIWNNQFTMYSSYILNFKQCTYNVREFHSTMKNYINVKLKWKRVYCIEYYIHHSVCWKQNIIKWWKSLRSDSVFFWMMNGPGACEIEFFANQTKRFCERSIEPKIYRIDVLLFSGFVEVSLAAFDTRSHFIMYIEPCN